ncbi:Methanogenesis regulatory histidine kinase FilI [uncultured archaeon]|nr:Methanogenesis regulatory histidine kinase FilI [uncultured archaeon]
MKVLIVDDNKINRMLLSKLLTSNKYKAEEAVNGIEALEKIKKSKPDIIISDVMMPRMDGFTLLRELKKENSTKDIPLVFYTSYYVSEKDRELAFKLGASRYIIRPIEPLELLDEVAAVLTEYEAGLIKPAKSLIKTDEEYLKTYSERIQKKLEEKIIELEQEITERKKAEEQIVQQKEFLTNIFESLTHPFYVIDAENRTIVMANPAARRGPLAIGSKCYEVTHRSDKPCSDVGVCTLEEVKKTKKPATLEHIHYDKDGNAANVEVHGYPVFDKEGNVAQMIEYCLDITERKRAEKEINLLASIVKNIPESVSTMDIKGNILSWNEGAKKMLGYKKEEILGRPIAITIPEEIAQKELDHCFGVLNKEGFFTGYESVRLTKDGRIIPVEITAVALKDDKQNITGYTSIIRDITERKKAEEMRLEKMRFEAMDKAKSEFLANMSHELRTPLNSIIGFSELMQQGISGGLNEKQKHFINNIHSSGNFLLSLINDILDLSKIEAGKIDLVIEKMPVPTTIAESLNLLKEKAMKHNIVLKTELDPQLDFILGDKQRFKQVMFNLLSNAVKFSKPEGGTVTITAHKDGEMAKFSVADTGIGIKEENIGKLFRKFEQLEPDIAARYGGTGLGLAITKQLVELHGGKIMAESMFGEGSTFTFKLPIGGKKREENEKSIDRGR